MDVLQRIWHNLAAGPSIVWVLWAGLAAVTITLLVMMRTRYGSSRPLRKCVVLSLVVHLLLCGYFWHVKLTGAAGTSEAAPSYRVTAVRMAEEEAAPAPRKLQPWQEFATSAAAPEAVSVQRQGDSWPAAPPQRPASEAPTLPPPVAPERLAHHPLTASQVDEFPSPDLRPDSQPAVDPAAADDLPPPHQPTQQTHEAPSTAAPARQETDASPGVVERPTASRSEPLPPTPPLVPRLAPSTGAASPLTEEFPDAHPAASAIATDVAPQDNNERSTVPSVADVGAPPRDDRPVSPSAIQKQGPEAGTELPPEREIPIATAAATDSLPREHQVPELYELRTRQDRQTDVQRRGGSPDTEAAVKAALAWLAANQESDGRWDADRHGAGREQKTQGHNRQGAGARADTGVTGLALMTFLGAGHTHEQGEYRETVQAAIDYLLASQAKSGDLGGDAEIYAAMYCHGMATLALAEAYGMTGDERLRGPLERAIDFTLRSQLSDGGWRYRPGDPRGDTSQLGWQLMALRSAQVSGLEVPERTRSGIVRFLRGVASGRNAGLASYRAGERASRSMTAEALFCRQLLGVARDNPSSDEAGDYVLGELPGDGETNLYYWYYATLSMYQLQGEHWETWNQALQEVLLHSQRQDGDLAGSYDPDGVWGPHGGRVYSTALATLCLEVYYRYLPVYSAMERRKLR